MNKVRTLLIDDEYLALRLLEDFASRLSILEVVDRVKSPLQAMETIQRGKIDLMFLDIQMPVMKGNQFLKSLHNPPVTIFTTAYAEYAIEAFDLGATDYLLKPFSFERFFQAVQKALDQIKYKKLEETSTLSGVVDKSGFLTIKADGKMYKIPFEEILYIEGLKEYLKVITSTKTYITLETFINMESMLPAPQFLRVHKSYMVAKDKVRSANGNMLEVGSAQIPISRERREALLKVIFVL